MMTGAELTGFRKTDDSPRNLKQLVGLALLFWIFWGSLVGLATYLGQSSLGWDIALFSTIAGNVVGWSFWGLVTPLVLWLGRKIRFSRKRLLIPILSHTMLAFTIGIGQRIYFGFFQSVIGHNFSNETYQQHIDFYLKPERILIDGSLTSLVYWLLLGGGYAYDYYRDSYNRKIQTVTLEKELSEARLTSLQYQLQPHFLFNTFHSVIALIATENNQAAIKMLTRLSDLLRASLSYSDRHEITLREELDLLNQYLEIIAIRFSEKLTTSSEIAPETMGAMVPQFILQPLVENAVIHGIEKKLTHGTISISTSIVKNRLLLTIIDDGVGFDTENKVSEKGQTGISNVRTRLATKYGDDYSLKLESKPNIGTTVELNIPLRIQE